MELLTNVFSYKLIGQEGNRFRLATDAGNQAAIVDLVELPGVKPGLVAGGSVHHLAFRVKDQAVQQQFRDQIAARGLSITEQIDRNYFYSVYFREPGGVLFEIATDNPGFTLMSHWKNWGKNSGCLPGTRINGQISSSNCL